MNKKIMLLSTDPQAKNLAIANFEIELLTVATSLETLLFTDADVLIIDEANPFSLATADLSRIVRTKNMEVVIITLAAAEDRLAKIANLEAGADDHQVKPVDHLAILARVNAVTRRIANQAQSQDASYKFHDLQLDQERRMCFVNEQEVALTRNEFATLLQLVKGNGKVVTREFLLKSIWERDQDDNSRPVDDVIRRLRKKLAAKHAKTQITTMWGHGYRVEL